jgi:hypothetical protein
MFFFPFLFSPFSGCEISLPRRCDVNRGRITFCLSTGKKYFDMKCRSE